MIRALLAGTKTQTRRVVKHQWPYLLQEPHYATGKVLTGLSRQPGAWMEFRHRQQDEPGYQGSPASTLVLCPYGQPGDRLWVREGHALDDRRVFYRAAHVEAEGSGPRVDVRWRPSIHMPRWASRITLEVTEVRVERLQSISEEDAIAEGCTLECMRPTGDDSGSAIHGPGGYLALWESINGPDSWDANPWVWVVKFKRTAP